MANLFEKELGIPLPKCCNTGACCKGASPSTPYHQLLKRAANGDEFARGFFSIMVPYSSHQEAEQVVPGIVERTLKAAQKQEEFTTSDDVVFYQCRYQTADNKCGVWEDRPQFCRDYPDTPFVVMAPGCAFEPWAAACKEKYNAMKAEVAKLKEMKEELTALQTLQAQGLPYNASTEDWMTAIAETTHPAQQSLQADALRLSLILSLTGIYLASPLQSFHFQKHEPGKSA